MHDIDDLRCLIKDFKSHFNFDQISGDANSLERWIIVPDVNRPGLELAGFFDHTEPKRAVVMGTKEIAYIKTMPEDLQWQRFDQLMDGWTPAIVITHGQECPHILLEVARRKNFPVFKTDLPTSLVMIDIITYLDEQLSPVESVHGVLMNVYGKGVLITGESGMGKSEIALELVKKGHILVSDDRVDIKRVHGTLMGQPPAITAGMLEIRGIGIINVHQMFGANSTISKSQIDFVIELELWNHAKEYMRAGIEEHDPYRMHGLSIPKLVFPVKEGRNMSMLVEAAVTNFTLKSRGIDSAREFEQRIIDLLKEKAR